MVAAIITAVEISKIQSSQDFTCKLLSPNTLYDDLLSDVLIRRLYPRGLLGHVSSN